MSKQIITILITAIIFFGLGYVISPSKITTEETNNINKKENTFQAGWNAAKERLVETNFMPMVGMEEMEIKSVSGNVQKIEGNKIALKIQPLEPLADPELDIRIIDVSNAKFYQSVQKDEEQYQKEMEEFDRKTQAQMNDMEMNAGTSSESIISPEMNDSEPIMFPDMFVKQEVSLNNIQVDQQISVMVNEDIKDKKEFKAIEINIQ